MYRGEFATQGYDHVLVREKHIWNEVNKLGFGWSEPR
jgi:hypothetical protein